MKEGIAPGSSTPGGGAAASGRASWLAAGAAFTAQLLLLGALVLAGDPAARALRTVALLLAAAAALPPLVRGARRLALPTAAVLAGALLLRLVLLPLPPALSSDVWRYLWEGRVAAAGGNPYVAAPDAVSLAALRDADWARIEHREIPAAYPPLALTAMSFAGRLHPAVRLAGWKLLVVAADLLACWLLLRLARATGRPPALALWYAANPLVALETAGMGHLEPLGVAAALGAGLAVTNRAAVSGGLAAAAAALAKLAPAAAWPMWARQSGKPGALLLSAALVTAVGLAPVVASAGGVPPGLAAYAARWEFAGPLHEPLWRLLAAIEAPDRVKHALDLTKRWTGVHEPLNPLYTWAYPQMLARALLAVAALAVIARSLRWREPVAGAASLFGALLLLSPTLYPWYLLWVLPWAALAGHRRWLWAAAVVPVAYLPANAGIAWWPALHALVWLPFLALWWRDRRCAGA